MRFATFCELRTCYLPAYLPTYLPTGLTTCLGHYGLFLSRRICVSTRQVCLPPVYLAGLPRRLGHRLRPGQIEEGVVLCNPSNMPNFQCLSM